MVPVVVWCVFDRNKRTHILGIVNIHLQLRRYAFGRGIFANVHYVSFVYSVVVGDCKGRVVIGERFGDHSGSLVLQHVFWVLAHLFSLLLAGRQVECHPVSNGEIGERLPISI